jgi:hypothetical protein
MDRRSNAKVYLFVYLSLLLLLGMTIGLSFLHFEAGEGFLILGTRFFRPCSFFFSSCISGWEVGLFGFSPEVP